MKRKRKEIMKHILISIQPQHTMNILHKDKILEIRKTIPKCELPCKVYIYCTKAKPHLYSIDDDNPLKPLNGRVVAEFTLNKIDTIEICDPDVLVNGKIVDVMEYKKDICISHDDFLNYIGYGDNHDGWGNKEWSIGYGWHIEDLKIYDKPKELSEFGIKRAFQSWGYIWNK